MAKLRKIRDEKEARRCVAAARASGNLGQWARAHGYDGRSLHVWAMNLARRAAAPTSRAKRPARPAEESAPVLVELVPARSTAAGPLVVQVGSVRIELGPDFDAGALRRLLDVLRAC
ncbi:MAG: hypothetical protein R3B07_37385 [Polyangiaceae bacterium]